MHLNYTLKYIKIILKQIKKQMLFSTTRQCNIQIIFFKYRTWQIKTTETNKKITYDITVNKMSWVCIISLFFSY